MSKNNFTIDLKKIHWLESFGDEDEYDLCAHGKVRITIGQEIVADNSEDEDDWWSLTGAALHLLRTLEMNHTFENGVGDCLIPGEGHVLDHHKDDPFVHVETVYPSVKGSNWWVVHDKGKIKLTTLSSEEIVIEFDEYKTQVLQFVDQVDNFYNISKPKVLRGSEYDKEGYSKLWNEWKLRRSKWKYT